MLQDQETTPKPALQPVFHKVAENLYRLDSSGAYYALVKKGGKQFRRSLKTKDRKLAERRLKEIKDQIGNLSASDDAKLPFATKARSNSHVRIKLRASDPSLSVPTQRNSGE